MSAQHYVVLGRGWVRAHDVTSLDELLTLEPTGEMAIGPVGPDKLDDTIDLLTRVVRGEIRDLPDAVAERLIGEEDVHDLRKAKPGGSGASRLVTLGGTFGGGVGLGGELGGMRDLGMRGIGDLAVNAPSTSGTQAPKPIGTNVPRNRKERRAKARMDKKFKAAKSRLAHEDRYTQAHEILDTEKVDKWDSLDREEQAEVLEQGEQSRDRW